MPSLSMSQGAALAASGALLDEVVSGLRAGAIIPYLGPGIVVEASVPLTPGALAGFFATKVALPKRTRGNPWAAAQYIESSRHRTTLTALMAEAFRAPVPATKLHQALARLKLPMIIDSWYDGAMRTALAEQGASWGEVQGITRAGIGEDCWFRYYDASGAPASDKDVGHWTTLLYKPHGAVVPAQNFLIADSDYVEVLTEIDIQSPIPLPVRERRTDRGFLFLGCRFDDQMLRTYARQIMKRSGGQHYAIFEERELRPNELKFMDQEGIVPLVADVAQLTAALTEDS